MQELKRAHPATASDGTVLILGQPAKRPYSLTASADVMVDTEKINHAYLEAITDIADEIKFAMKCMERSAGEETSLASTQRVITSQFV